MTRARLLPLVFLALSAPAFAANTRSAVSVNGSDLNPCTTTSPCRSLSVAVTATNPGGEVIAMDTGGFGAFAATQSITVSAAPGFHAAVTTSAGNAISVAAGPTDSVVLRNLIVLAASGANNGIDISQAQSVHISNCLVRGFTGHFGININTTGAETSIDHTVIQQNGVGVVVQTNAAVGVRVTNSQIDDGGTGIYAINDVKAVVSNTSFMGNSYGVWLQTTLQTVGDMTFDHCIFSGNGTGIHAENPDVNNRAVVRLFFNVISYNQIGVDLSAAYAYTYGNNALSANGTDVNGGLTPLAQR